MNELAATDNKIAELPTSIRAVAASKRAQPTAQIVDDINASREIIRDAQAQRATIEAFMETKIDATKNGFEEREKARRAQIATLQDQVTALIATGERDADDMRSTIRAVTAQCTDQIAAVDRRITAHQNIIRDLSA